MRGDHAVAGLLSHLDGVEGFGDGADLVDLDENRVGGAHLDALGQTLGVGDEEVVANDLDLLAQGLGEGDVAFPVALIKSVFDRVDGILLDPLGVLGDHVCGGEQLVGVGLPELVALAVTFVEQLRGGAVEGDLDLGARLVTCGDDRLHDHFQGFVVGQVGREAAFVADGGDVLALLQDALEGVEDFRDPAQTFGEGLGADGGNHELLEVDQIVSMLATVDDVGHRNGQGEVLVLVQLADVLPEGQVLGGGSGAANGHGHGQHGVGAQLALVLGAVERDHALVQTLLVFGVETLEGLGDGAVDVGDGLEHAATQVDLLVAVAQFHGFEFAGGSARGHRGATERTIVEGDVGFHGGVATGVEDLAGNDLLDLGHSSISDEYS